MMTHQVTRWFGQWAAALLLTIATLTPVSRSVAQILDTPGDRIEQQLLQQDNQTLKLTSRIHVQKGSDTGYLVVKLDLKPGEHIYSLTQKGSIPPSKITVQSNPQFQLTDKFNPDKPAKVVAKDPVFGQRVEKHEGPVQFFAPIKLKPGFSAPKLQAKVQFDGQVCSFNSCMPLRKAVIGKFAGYFQRSKKSNKSPIAAQPSSIKR